LRNELKLRRDISFLVAFMSFVERGVDSTDQHGIRERCAITFTSWAGVTPCTCAGCLHAVDASISEARIAFSSFVEYVGRTHLPPQIRYAFTLAILDTFLNQPTPSSISK
jgi:hypothetical protein